MERLIKYRWIFAAHILLMFAAYSITGFLNEGQYQWYFRIVAFAWVIPPAFLLWCFWKTKAYDVLVVWFVLSLSNVCDEFFFNPEKVQFNEVVFAVIAIMACFFRYRKHGK